MERYSGISLVNQEKMGTMVWGLWEYLAQTRNLLQEYITGQKQGQITEEALEQALTQMYIAEGSDWFWWYGSDQDSGNDGSFDQQFRDTLEQVYLALGEDPPTFIEVPIIPEDAVTAERPSTGIISPTYISAGRVKARAINALSSVLSVNVCLTAPR